MSFLFDNLEQVAQLATGPDAAHPTELQDTVSDVLGALLEPNDDRITEHVEGLIRHQEATHGLLHRLATLAHYADPGQQADIAEILEQHIERGYDPDSFTFTLIDSMLPWRHPIDDHLLTIIRRSEGLTADETSQLAEYMRTKGLEENHYTSSFYFRTIRPAKAHMAEPKAPAVKLTKAKTIKTINANEYL